MGITILKNFICGGISLDICLAVRFYSFAWHRRKTKFPNRISHDIPPQMKTLNTVRVSNLTDMLYLPSFHGLVYTVKPVLSSHSKIDKTKILLTNGSLMKVKSICKMLPLEHSAILLTCIKR